MRILGIKLCLAFELFLQRYLRFVHRFIRCYPLRLHGVRYSKRFRRDVLILQVAKKSTTISVRLQDLLKQHHLLKHLCPLDIALILLLAKENRFATLLSSASKRLRDIPNLKKFQGIDNQFYSERIRHEMIIVTVPNSDNQLCLSVRELINHQSLLQNLRKINRHTGKSAAPFNFAPAKMV